MENTSPEKKMKHLEMIEAVIERMGNNSFQLKGWAVTLVSVVSTLAAQGTDKRFFLITFIPLFSFWFLDAYYLQMERKYRQLYKIVSGKEENLIDFNMDTKGLTYLDNEMEKVCYCSCLFSETEWPFYLVIAGAVSGIALLLLLT